MFATNLLNDRYVLHDFKLRTLMDISFFRKINITPENYFSKLEKRMEFLPAFHILVR